MESLGTRIRARREQLKKKQKDLALFVGVGQQTICAIEQDRIDVRIKHLPKIAEFLGMTMAELLGESALPPQQAPVEVTLVPTVKSLRRIDPYKESNLGPVVPWPYKVEGRLYAYVKSQREIIFFTPEQPAVERKTALMDTADVVRSSNMQVFAFGLVGWVVGAIYVENDIGSPQTPSSPEAMV